MTLSQKYATGALYKGQDEQTDGQLSYGYTMHGKKLTVVSFILYENSDLLYRSADDTKQSGVSTVQKCRRLRQRRDEDV